MRIVLIAAILIALTAAVYLSMRVGRYVERTAAKAEADRIDPQTYREMANLIRLVFGAQPVDDPAYIPRWMKSEAEPVLNKINPVRRTGR